MRSDRNRHSFSIGFILGGLVGAGLVFIFGTKEGKKVKKKLCQKGQKFIDDFPEIIDDLQEQGKDLARKAEEIRNKVDKQVKKLKKADLDEGEKRLQKVRRKKHFFTKKGRELG